MMKQLPFTWIKQRPSLQVVIGLALFLWIFFIFRNALVAAPRADHWLMMDERQLASSDLSYFWNTLSLDRARHLGVVNQALFRPGMHALLALQDIFLRPYLLTKGLLSLSFHFLLVITLFLLLKRFSNTAFATLAAFALATVYPGKDLVTWRHMSPYLVGLLFFVIGIAQITKSPARYRRAFIYFFIATLFHEVISVSLFLASVAVLSTDWKKTETRKIFATLCSPSLAFFFINFINYYLLKNPTLSAELTSQSAPLYQSLTYHFFLTTGFLITGALFPWRVTLSNPTPLAKTIWNFSSTDELLFTFQGFLFLILLTALGIRIWTKIRKGEETSRHLAAGCFLICFCAVSLGLAKIRSSAQGSDYLRISPYYLYFGHALLIPLLALLFSPNFFSARRILRRGLALGLLLWIGIQSLLLQIALKKTAPYETALRETVSTIQETLTKLPGYFYAGSLDEETTETAPTKLFFDRAGFEGRKSPLYAFRTDQQELWLGTLKPLITGNLIPVEPFYDPTHQVNIYLSHFPVADPQTIAVFSPDFFGSWITHFENEKNFVMLTIHHRLISTYQFINGKQRSLMAPLQAPVIVEREAPLTLGMRTFHDETFLFSGERLLQRLDIKTERETSKTYRAGFALEKNQPLEAKLFSFSELNGNIIPIIKLPLNLEPATSLTTQHNHTTQQGIVPRG